MRLIAALVVAITTASLRAQGSAEDYDRADSFGSRFANKVLNEKITLTWLDGGRAWYVRAVSASEREFVLVDAERATKKLAFDHTKVAEALGKACGKPVDPKRIPSSNFSLSPDATKATFSLDDRYEVNLSNYEVKKGRQPGLAGLKAFPPEEVTESGGGGDQTSITFANQSDQPLKIWWIQDDGDLREYQTLQPGKEWSIQTWVTHYWMVTRVDGFKLAAYKPDRNGSTAYISGKRVPYDPPKPQVPNISPDSKWQISFKDNQARLNQLDSKKVTMLTMDGSITNRFQGPVFWSPDSKSVVFYQVEPEESHPLNIVKTTPEEQFQPKLTSRQYLKPGDRIAKPVMFLYRIGEEKPVKIDSKLYPNPWELDQEQWIDNDHFVFRYNQRGHQVMRLIELTASTGTTRTVIDEQSKTFIDWTAKSFYYQLPKSKKAIWQSERSGWSHLYLADLVNGTQKAITTGNWVMRRVERVDEAKQQIWFTGSGQDANHDPYQVHFYRVNIDGSNLIRLTDGEGNHRIEFSPDGKYLLDTYSSPDKAPQHEIRRATDGKKVIDLERADASELLKNGFRMPQVFSAKGRDGKTDIWGHVYFPTTFEPSKKYPVVEDIYAGPHSSHVPKNFHTNSSGMQIAELGFIVVRIDGMGTSNRSKAFHDVCWQNISDAGFPDRILWMQSVAKQIPAMDLSRVGIYGTSAGGQNTLHALLTHGEFYKVGIADCGCYDNRMDKIWWNEQWMGWPIGPHYTAQSGRTLAKNLTGKLLLLLGEEDTNVDPASTYQVIDALIKADKDFDFVTIPNVGHGAAGHPYGRRKLRDFLVRNLLGVEPRWNVVK
jgi:dipeptidyl-peptidase 4